jgi:hypothetical protein
MMARSKGLQALSLAIRNWQHLVGKRGTRIGTRGRHRHWVDAFLFLFLFLLFFGSRATPMSLNHVLQGKGLLIEILLAPAL